MEMEDKILKVLKLFGLTEYEASAYLALNYMISATAPEIGERANIPRSRVYEILKMLLSKSFVEVERGRPLKYSVVQPTDIFEMHKNKIIQEMEEAERELNMIYENNLSNIPAPMWLIHGPGKIIKKELEIISRAKESVNIRMGFLFQNEADPLKKIINRKIKKGVKVNIMASKECMVDNEKIKILKELNEFNGEIMQFPLPYVKMIIRDNKEMLHVFSKFSDSGENVISQTAIGVWNQYEDIAKNYNKRFEDIWNRKLKNKKKNRRNKNYDRVYLKNLKPKNFKIIKGYTSSLR